MQEVPVIEFSEISEQSLIWDKVYNKYGVAFRNTLEDVAFKDGVWEINMTVFIFCLKGHMSFSENGKVFNVSSREVLVRLPGMYMSECMVSPDFKCKIWCFSPELTQQQFLRSEFFDKAIGLSESPVLKMYPNDDTIELMDAYEKIFQLKTRQTQQQYFPLIVENLVRCLQYEIASNIPGAGITNGLNDTYSKASYLKKFANLLSEDKGRKRNVGKYAELLHISPKYLSAICKESVGKSAFELITDVLKKEIVHLLSDTDLSVKEIAADLNFPDASFFSKYVRIHFGMTALEYRDKLRKDTANTL